MSLWWLLIPYLLGVLLDVNHSKSKVNSLSILWILVDAFTWPLTMPLYLLIKWWKWVYS